jgi:hypothetical protein
MVLRITFSKTVNVLEASTTVVLAVEWWKVLNADCTAKRGRREMFAKFHERQASRRQP